MEADSNLLAVAIVSLLAAISPGPDFFIVLRNSITYSRRIGWITAFGVALALIIHLTYTLVGIGVLLVESVFFYHLVKYAGASYLFYIGLCGLRSSFQKSPAMHIDYEKSTAMISPLTALKQGFLTNLLNPKCAVFFISLFSQFISDDTSVPVRIEYAIVNWTVSLGWFLLLSYVVTGSYLMTRINRFRMYIDRAMGAALILLSLRMALI